jgi:protein-tyrosine phosphatase
MSFFSKFFSKPTETKHPIDLSVVKCDVHSHFIPGIDDGAASLEESLELIRTFHDLGYKKIITTPHILADGYPNTAEIILEGLEKVKAALKAENIPMQMEAAAEYYLDYDFGKKVETEKLLTFGDNYLLFEISYLNPPDNLEQVVFQMQTMGYQPVLAHPERYTFWLNNWAKYERLKEKGVLFQLNINSLTGYYSNEVRSMAEEMIERRMINFLGSDCHHLKHASVIKNSAVYKIALQKLLDSGVLLNHTLL